MFHTRPHFIQSYNGRLGSTRGIDDLVALFELTAAPVALEVLTRPQCYCRCHFISVARWSPVCSSCRGDRATLCTCFARRLTILRSLLRHQPLRTSAVPLSHLSSPFHPSTKSTLSSFVRLSPPRSYRRNAACCSRCQHFRCSR